MLTLPMRFLTSFVKRILPSLAAFWIIVSLTFILMKVLPGDPFQAEQALPEEIHNALRRHYGLDDPWYQQYNTYLKSIFSWNFGPSFRYRDRTVNEIIHSTFPVSALLGAEALCLALFGGIFFGSLAAKQKGRWSDGWIMVFATIGVSVPSFVLASLMQYFLAMKLGLFPIARLETFSATFLPALALAALPMAFIARLVRASLLDVLKHDYIQTARAKGLSPYRILIVHALRQAIFPVISYLGPLITNILVGSFVIEKIFAIPGLGQWFVNSVINRDYTVIMGTTVFYSLILLTMILIVDCVYALLDPRIRLHHAR